VAKGFGIRLWMLHGLDCFVPPYPAPLFVPPSILVLCVQPWPMGVASRLQGWLRFTPDLVTSSMTPQRVFRSILRIAQQRSIVRVQLT
jgi:hypothetical protein